MNESRKGLYLGMVLGVLMSGVVALAAFLYFDGPALIDSAFATNRSERLTARINLCDRLDELGDPELVYELGWFANRHHRTDEVVGMGRKSVATICERAHSFVRQDLTPAEYSQLTSCVSAAQTADAARHCFAD